MLLKWDDTWDLNIDICPCDVHFLDWIEKKDLYNQKIFHMGSGAHHIVGFSLAQANRNHLIYSITAAPSEYKCGIQLLMGSPKIGWAYKPIFGDIYQTDPRQYNSLDIVTLFHICEITNEILKDGPGLSYEETVRMFVSFLNPGGFLVGYKESFKFSESTLIFSKLEKEGLINYIEDHLSLRVWAKASNITNTLI